MKSFSIAKTLQEIGSVPMIIMSVALILFLGFAATRITKKLKLPNVTAYIVTGILLGPFCLNVIPQTFIDSTDFLSDIALAFIAFSTGEFFKLKVLKENGLKVAIITVFEALMATLFVFVLTYIVLGLPLSFSLVIAALASATAPASTMMTIRQTGAKGDFVNTLLQVVALDDIVALLAYSIAISLAIASSSGQFSLVSVIKPIALNIGVFILGGIFGFLLRALMPKSRTTDNRLIIAVATLFLFCGICALVDVSPLLGCMSMGTVYSNICDEEDTLFKQVNYFSPPFLLLFFVRSGLNFDLHALTSTTSAINGHPLLLVGVLYFIIRIAGKYVGAFVGCLLSRKDKLVRNYLGLALIPQAGVAIGLAALGARSLGGETGDNLQTIILASSVLYELVGPAAAKLSLTLSKSYSNNLEDITHVEMLNEDGTQKSEVEILIERINKIQEKVKEKNSMIDEDEKAFIDASEEQYVISASQLKRRRK